METDNILVKQPVIDIINKLDSIDDSFIVLTGGSGFGKTTVLKMYETLNNNVFYNWYDSIGNVIDQVEDQEFIDQYYEILVTQHLLFSLERKNYNMDNLKNLKKELNSIYSKIIKYLNSRNNSAKWTKDYISKGYFVEQIIERFKDIVFVVDCFDSINNVSHIAQEKIYSYKDYFKKMIIGVTDKECNNKYSTIDLDYSKNFEVVSTIIRNYIIAKNLESTAEERLDLDLINNESLKYLISTANGDLNLVLNVINDLYNYNYIGWYGEITKENASEYLKEILNDRIIRKEKIKKMIPTSKLYI